MADMLTTTGQCCSPIPGDQITGYITRGRGVTVHRADCHNVINHREPERFVEVEWAAQRGRSYGVPVRLDAADRVGLLRDISNVVSGENVNMYGVRTTDVNDGAVAIFATLEVTSMEQLLRLFARLEMIRSVRGVARAVDGAAPIPGF
jgi:GTP pyrophosphokinase